MPLRRTLLIFALLGPPIGWLVFIVFIAFNDNGFLKGLRELAEGWDTVLIGIPMSYIIGIIPALFVALLMVLAPTLRMRPGPLYAAAVGLFCGVVFAFVWKSGFEPLHIDRFFIFKVLTCLVPTLICWWLARSKRVDGIEAGNEAVKE